MANDNLFPPLDEHGEDAEGSWDVPLFPLRRQDQTVVETLRAALRELCQRQSITAEQLHGVSLVLHGLEMLPQPSSGLDAELTLRKDGGGGNLVFTELRINEQVFELSSGGWIADSEVGGESYSDLLLRAEMGCDSCDGTNAVAREWVRRFQRMVRDEQCEVEVAVYEEGRIEWDYEPDDADWQRLRDDDQ